MIHIYGKIKFQYSDSSQAKKGELTFAKNQIALELHKEKSMANIEVKKFADMVSAIGADTLAAIATAGPDMQVINVLLNRNEDTGFGIKYRQIQSHTNYR